MGLPRVKSCLWRSQVPENQFNRWEELEPLSQDRRLSQRFTLQLPVTLVLPDSGLRVRGKTRDISSAGIFFYANLPVEEHEEVKLLMTLPYEFAVVPVRVACHAKVLRIEQDEFSGQKGMAAAIQRFDFLEADYTSQPMEELDPL